MYLHGSSILDFSCLRKYSEHEKLSFCQLFNTWSFIIYNIIFETLDLKYTIYRANIWKMVSLTEKIHYSRYAGIFKYADRCYWPILKYLWFIIYVKQNYTKPKHILFFTSSFPRCENCNIFFRKFPKHRLTLGLLFPHFLKAKVITNRTLRNLVCVGNLAFLFDISLFKGHSLWEKLLVLLIMSNSKPLPLSGLWHCHWIRFGTTM